MTNPLRRILMAGLALVLAVSSINLGSAANVYAAQHPPANNGTLKIHEFGTPSGTESNDPKVCAFNFEGFSFDPSQSGYIVVETQPGGVSALQMPFGPADANGSYASPYINNGGAYTLANGQYKATVYGKKANNPSLPNLNDEKAKSKVFKVECAVDTPVTPTVPTSSDLCGTANDTYTIPQTAGVTYRINNQDVAAGTYAGSGTVIITAVANSGYTIQGTASWTFTFSQAACTVTVTPAAPTVIDLCGTTNDTLTIPATQGVTYRVNGTVTPAGTYPANGLVVVTANANQGYVLQGTKVWTLLFTNLPCVAVPTAPIKSDMCGTQNDTYTIPSVTGVKYYANGVEKAAGTYSAPGIVLIVAVAKPGYVLDIHSQQAWLFTFSDKKCPQPCHTFVPLILFGGHKWDDDDDDDDEDCIPVSVTPVAPTKVDTCGINGDTYTIPSTTGVIYKVNGTVTAAGTYKATGTVTITAVAADSGYVIANGQTAAWTFEFTNVSCPKADIGIVAECTFAGVLVKLINSGDADGTVYVNGTKVLVAMGKTAEITVPTLLYKATVTVLDADNETVLLDQAFDCTPGMGSAGGPVATPPAAPAAPAKTASVRLPAADLPVTGTDSVRQVLTLILIAVTVYGATYFLQGRLKLRENE